MTCDKKRTICFFIRHEIDLDHATPIISNLVDSKGISLILINTNSRESFSQDWRIKILKRKGVRITHLACLHPMSGFLLTITLKNVSPVANNLIDVVKRIIFNRVVKTLSEKYLDFFMRHLSYEQLSSLLRYDEVLKLAVFDHKISRTYNRLASIMHRNAINTVSLPHGPGFGADYSESSGEKMPYSIIFASNDYQRAHLKKKNDNVITVGSSRFSKTWIDQVHKIVPSFKLDNENQLNLKIVMMAKKPLRNFNQADMDTTLSEIAKISGVQLVLKSHPRDRVRGDLKNSNLIEVDSDVPSSALISWADLVLFTHSSIVLEAVQLDKPLIYLKYLVENYPTHEKLEVGWGVNSLEELFKWLERLKVNRTTRTYSKEERQRIITAFIQAGDSDGLEKSCLEMFQFLDKSS